MTDASDANAILANNKVKCMQANCKGLTAPLVLLQGTCNTSYWAWWCRLSMRVCRCKATWLIAYHWSACLNWHPNVRKVVLSCCSRVPERCKLFDHHSNEALLLVLAAVHMQEHPQYTGKGTCQRNKSYAHCQAQHTETCILNTSTLSITYASQLKLLRCKHLTTVATADYLTLWSAAIADAVAVGVWSTHMLRTQ